MLGAIDTVDSVSNYKISELGKKMAAFPVDPRMSKSLIAAHTSGCL